MNIDELRHIAAKEELSLNYVAKDEMISKILLSLQQEENIILKGGTALNRVFIGNKRFSEDIDFDILFHGTPKEALPLTRKIVMKIKDFTIEEPQIMNETIRYDLLYTNPLNHRDKIRLEFHVLDSVNGYKKQIVNFGFVPFPAALLHVYEKKTLIQHKIACILTRLEGKDFFDLYYLLDLQKEKIKITKQEKEALLKRLTMDRKQLIGVANIINHYIPKQRRPHWETFLEELKEKIETWV